MWFAMLEASRGPLLQRMDEMTERTLRILNAQETSEERARLEQVRGGLRKRLAKILGNPFEVGAIATEEEAPKHDTAT